MKTKIYLLVAALLCFAAASAQTGSSGDSVFALAKVHRIESKLLSQTRYLNVYLPDAYAADTTTQLPVLYLLDGSAGEDFVHIVGIVQFLNMIGSLPPTIVVGIANTDRKHDFTHPATVEEDRKLLPTSGGSAAFLAFIGQEVQPFVRKQYRAGGTRTIIGQSLGGLLATEALLRQPGLFDQYIIVSPSLWWNNGSLLAEAGSLLKNIAKPVTVCLCLGSEGKEMDRDVKKLVSILTTTARGKVKLHFIPMPAETHLTILHRAVYRVFEILYPLKKE